MSNSGPLPPTVSQEGGSPFKSAQDLPTSERAPAITTSSSTSPLTSYENFSTKGTNEDEKTCTSLSLVQRPQSLLIEDPISSKCIYTGQNLHLVGPKINPGKKNEYLQTTPSGEEKVTTTSEWTTTYSEMFQDEGGGDGPAFVESDDDAGSTPPAVSWAKSLRNLLEDDVGSKAFLTFFLQELGSGNMLEFWFACNGLHKLEQTENFENIREAIQVIWKKFIRKQIVKVTQETYRDIEVRIARDPTDPQIFNQAQYEVEKEINETLYRAFLESDLYLSYLIPVKKEVGADSPPSSPIPYDECSSVPSKCLPTLHEDSEFDTRCNQAPRLTSSNLLASAIYRANIERIKPEGNAGHYLKGRSLYKPNPYHVSYISGHSVSLHDSERQSLSSGAHTDDTKSCTDSSLDASSSFGLAPPMNRKQQRRQAQKIKENAMQNREPRLISSVSGSVHVVPRTMHYNQSNAPRPTNPEEFMKILTEKLEKYQLEKDTKERLNQSINKLAHSEGAPEEIRREHAVTALPPKVLFNRLHEKVQLDDQDPSQSILDEHVARVWDWDSPVYSPNSPKHFVGDSPPNRSSKGTFTRQLPHLTYPSQFVKPSKHHNIPTTVSSPSALYPNIIQSALGTRGRHAVTQGVGGYSIGHAAPGYQPRNGHHGRRKERGQDVYSTFSSDSGNVADYHDCTERLPPSYLPKSKSMPEYIENQTGGMNEAAHRRYCGSGTRRCCRRTPADFTDSGVSVVSDSGRSGAPSSSSERVESWLFQNHTSNSGNSSCSVCPGVEREFSKEYHRAKDSRSTHTMAGSTSPGAQRKWVANSGRRSQSSGSTSANTCILIREEGILSMSPGQLSRPHEMTRDSPLGQAQPCLLAEKKKVKGGSSSGKSTGHSSSFEGSGSNGSTMKAQKASKQGGEPIAFSAGVSSSSAVSSPSSEVTTIVYSFQDDHVPFIIKVPSRPVTLKKFKQHLHKKGSFRYFFKKFCEDMGMVYEEITDDGELLPFFDGKVFVQIHKDD